MNLPEMSTVAPYQAKSMKTRDKIKYAFASFLALMTILAIAGLIAAKYERKKATEAELKHIQSTLGAYGRNGGLPPKIEMPEQEPAPAASFK